MASENSNSGIVAIFAIMLLAMIGGFIAWQAGVFGEGETKKVDINVTSPVK